MTDLVFGSELAVVRVTPLPQVPPPATITFMPEPAWIKVVLPATRGRPYGLISGAEGQGSEIVFMEDGTLGELVLEMQPRDAVEMLRAPLVAALLEEVRMRRSPAQLDLLTRSKQPLVADLVGLSPSLDLAAFSFCGWLEMGHDRWRDELGELQLAAVADGVTLGLSSEGHVAWALVEGFLRQQQVLGIVVDAERNAAAVAVLDDLHRCYYQSSSQGAFDRCVAAIRSRVASPLADDAELATVFERLVHGYRNGLAG